MKNTLVLAGLWLAAAAAWADKPAPNPADYTIAVQVVRSTLFPQCVSGLCNLFERMDVVIDGKKYELTERTYRSDLLRTGAYKAHVLKDETTRSYEYQRTYELLLPDGKTRQYLVTGEEQ